MLVALEILAGHEVARLNSRIASLIVIIERRGFLVLVRDRRKRYLKKKQEEISGGKTQIHFRD